MGSTLGNLKNSMPGGTDVADPHQAWGNMDSSQKGVQVLGGLKGGIGQGIQNYQQQSAAMQQPQGGGQIGPMTGAQPVDPSYFQPQKQRTPNMLNFYGGQ